jgi:putative radical SAM enzyme (TIGR03279 family)
MGQYNVIRSVDADSPLRGKLQAGDTLLSINGRSVEDVLDYRYHSYDARLTLELKCPDGSVRSLRVKKDVGADLGLEFDSYLMDEARACRNRCLFCFVDQLPRGMRRTLYFKDDDARLSFLTGNYITLTNLSERELQRICDLRVSPLRVSVHATDPALRARLLGNPKAEPILPLLRRLAGAGITVHCQIVCCPGLNDGEALSQTMSDLAGLYPSVSSVSVVPVGLTKHRQGLPQLSPFDRERAAETAGRVERFAQDCLRECGSRIFFCADELYLKAGLPLPPDVYYEDYPQLENGVGLLRLLTEEFMAALEETEPREGSGEPVTIATGAAASETIAKLALAAAGKCDRIKAEIIPVYNDFFGRSVDVAGLLTGGDLIAQLQDRRLGRRLLISRSMLRHGEDVFLDNVSLKDLEQALGVPVAVVEPDGAALLRAILG